MADFDLKNFEHWWKLLAAAGAAMAIAGVAAKLTPAIFLGAGVMLLGVGEWINHPLQTQLGHGFKITGYPRSNSIAGILFDVVGGVLAVAGFWKLSFV